MKTPNGKIRIGAMAAAVQAALLAISAPAHAEDPDVAALTTPDNFVEFGVANADHKSAKFGEYTGMNKNGAYAVGNFSIKGGDGYGQGDGLTRWSVSGSNLGLDSREINGQVSQQGKWSIGVGYDELRHYTTDGYQTPYAGTMGGNSFTLPASFAGSTADTNALTPTQLSSFNTSEISNTRKNTSLNAGYVFSPAWRLTVDYNNLKQSGAKLMAFGGDATTGVLGTAGFSYTSNGGQKVSILPNPTNYTTDTVNIALDWTGEKGNVTAGYFGSFFRDHYNSVSWQTFGTNATNQTDTMTTAPSNDFHQLNLSGGYRFSPETKLAGGLSYGRNTQNSPFVYSNLLIDATPTATPVALPAASLDGVVVTTNANLKLSNQTTKDLRLSAGFKYDKRDNRTQSNIYSFYAINGTADPASYPNTPYSNKKTQIELAGDYRLSAANKIRLSYNHDDTKRWCNNYAVSASYPAGTNCLVDTGTKEDKFALGYKRKASETVDLTAGYAYAKRKTTYDPTARVAMVSVKGVTSLGLESPTAADAATGIKGLNGGDYLGFHPFFDASRTQQQLKLGATWQANEKLSLGINGRYTDDKYHDDPYGAQDGKSWNATFDANYAYAEDGAVFGYVTQQYRDRYVTHVTDSYRAPTRTSYAWGDRLKDSDTTWGLGFKQGGLLGGKLDLAGDLTFSDAKSNYSTSLLSVLADNNSTIATTCFAANTLSCGSAPDITNKLTQFKLTGTYKLDKQSKVSIGYLYQKLSSTDYFYNGYQYGYTPTGVMPTNQQSGSYSVNAVAASYIYSFK